MGTWDKIFKVGQTVYFNALDNYPDQMGGARDPREKNTPSDAPVFESMDAMVPSGFFTSDRPPIPEEFVVPDGFKLVPIKKTKKGKKQKKRR